MTEGETVVNNGELFSAGKSPGIAAGDYGYFQLYNPGNSGILCFLYQIVLTAEVDSVVSLRGHHSRLTHSMTTCNSNFGAGPSKCEARYEENPNVVGSEHAFYGLAAKQPFVIELPAGFPLLQINEGQGVVVFIHQKGADVTCNFKWREAPETE